MSCHQKNDTFNTLKGKNLYAKNLKARKGKFCKLEANNADIKNLDVQNIIVNGRDLTCTLSLPESSNYESPFDPVGPTGSPGCEDFFDDACPLKPTNVNQTVWDCLLKNAASERDDLQFRLEDGRQKIQTYLNNFPCPQSCPPPPTEPVPIEIYATKTLPVFRRFVCGATGPFCGVTGPTGSYDNLVSAMNFNLDVYYQLDVAESIDARVVSVLIQVGYIDPLGPTGGCTGASENVVIDTVYIGNKQFYPTLDTEYGENFAGSINIPSNLIYNAVKLMPNPCDTGAVQLVVFKEKGLCIWTNTGDGNFECRGGGSGSSKPNPPVSVSSVNVAPINCPAGQIPNCTSSGTDIPAYCVCIPDPGL